jgi:antibiotic biosynthesis monooxygenase (ABM) superfamily enzyme
VIERHITFNVHPDLTADFERFFRETYRPAMSRARGFVRVELIREGENAARYQMMLRFQDVETAAEWRTCAEHQALQPELTSFYSTNEIVGYVVVA